MNVLVTKISINSFITTVKEFWLAVPIPVFTPEWNVKNSLMSFIIISSSYSVYSNGVITLWFISWFIYILDISCNILI